MKGASLTGGFAVYLAALLVLAASATAEGQVRPVQDGRALDANYGLGSGGYNTPARPGRLDTQLYVTGQVTGLSRFRGGVPYAAPNELRLDLPSSSLETFRRQSVGLRQAVGGAAYRTSVYYDRARTILSVPRVAAGAAAPGTSMPVRSSVPSPLAGQLYVRATSDYGSIAVLRPEHLASATPVVSSFAPAGLEAGKLPTGVTGPRGAEPYRSLERFGIRKPGEEPTEGPAEAPRLETRIDLQVDTAVDTRVESVSTAAVPGQEPQALRGAGQFDARRARLLEELGYESDQDVFIDMLIRLNQLRTGRESREPRPEESAAPVAAPGEPPLVEIAGESIVIHGLAGISQNILNVYLAAGEEKLRSGRFYEAAAAYEAAAGIAPANPLPRIGVAVSLFAAGEPYAAAVYLREAMELLPPVMEMQVDLKKILGPQLKVWESRTKDLEKRLEAEAPDSAANLRFIAVYACRQLAREQDAKAHAAGLSKAAKEDKVLSAYAEWVLSGKRPAQRANVRSNREEK